MSTLTIRKKSLKTWLHTDSILGSFIISKFYFNADNVSFQIVEQGQSRRVIYNITDITLYALPTGGTAETFTTITELSLRLEELNYPAFQYDGQITSIANLIDAGTGVIITGDGTAESPYIINSIGGAGSLFALPFTTNHISANGNQYTIGDVVYYSSNVYICIAANDSILPTNTLYWNNLGAGYPLVQEPADWNSTSGNNQILNKPTIGITPTLQEVLDNNHDLVDGNFFAGTGAGDGNTEINVNAFGGNAANSNTGMNVNALGDSSGIGNSFNNVNLLGNSATADENGQTVLSKDGAIMARISTTELTDTRKYNLPDGDGTLALTTDVTTPTLQEVTDEGNTLTDTEILFDSAFGNKEILINVDDGIYVKDIDSDKLAFIEQSGLGISNYDGTNATYLLEEGFNHTSSVNFQKLTFDTIASDEEIIIPNASGTIALTSDITTPTLQQVTDAGNETNGRIIVIESGVSSITINNSNIERVEYDLSASTQLTFQNSETNNNIIAFPDASGTLALTSDIPTSSTFVPYTGATSDLDLGTYNINADHISLNVSPTGAGFVEGATQWNNELGSSQTLLKGGNVTLKNGVDLVARIVNKVAPNTTLTKANYQVVRISGASGQRLAVDLAQANNDNNSADTLGIVCETIATNQQGFILTMGHLLDINTTGSLQGETWGDGDVLYLSPTTAGAITNRKPTGATGHIVVLGYVEYAHANNGKIYVKIMNGWELDELHNVYISSVENNQILSYETATSLWKNKSIGAILGYTPYKFVQTSQTAHTGTTAETIVATAIINGGTFNSSDSMKMFFKLTKQNGSAAVFRLKINTTNSLVGATQIALSNFTSLTNTYIFGIRNYDLQGGNLYGYNFNSSLILDIVNTNTVGSSTAYNTANTLYIFFTLQLSNPAFSVIPNLCEIRN